MSSLAIVICLEQWDGSSSSGSGSIPPVIISGAISANTLPTGRFLSIYLPSWLFNRIIRFGRWCYVWLRRMRRACKWERERRPRREIWVVCSLQLTEAFSTFSFFIFSPPSTSLIFELLFVAFSLAQSPALRLLQSLKAELRHHRTATHCRTFFPAEFFYLNMTTAKSNLFIVFYRFVVLFKMYTTHKRTLWIQEWFKTWNHKNTISFSHLISDKDDFYSVLMLIVWELTVLSPNSLLCCCVSLSSVSSGNTSLLNEY